MKTYPLLYAFVAICHAASPADPLPASDKFLTEPNASILDASGARTGLKYSTCRIVETKAGDSNLSALANNPLVGEIANGAMQSGANNALAKVNGRFGGALPFSSALSGLGKKLLKSDESTLTYACALDGTAAGQTLSGSGPTRFEIKYASIPGLDPDEFEPALVKVAPSPNSLRLIGSIKTKKRESGEAARCELKVVEDRVSAKITRVARGHAELAPSAPLPPGDYAIVLRPIAGAKKKFQLHEFEQGNGEAGVLRIAWNFGVSAAQ
jgi:hypothetical protein